MPVFADLNKYEERLENAEKYAETNIGIPFSPYITDDEQKKVISIINEYFGGTR